MVIGHAAGTGISKMDPPWEESGGVYFIRVSAEWKRAPGGVNNSCSRLLWPAREGR